MRTPQVTKCMVEKINEVVLADGRVSIKTLAKDHGISVGSVSNILYHRLNFRKVSACEVDSTNANERSKANSSKNLQGASL